MSSHLSNQTPEAAVDTPPRRKRLRHGWSEASNPHDRMVKAIGWITLSLIVIAVTYLVLRSLNFPTSTP